MNRKVLIAGIFATALLSIPVRPTAAKGDDFGAVVRVIEHFYHVKHAGIPFLARAGIKTARTAARIAGGTAKRVAEAGSVKVAYFEDQEFNSHKKGGACRHSRSISNRIIDRMHWQIHKKNK